MNKSILIILVLSVLVFGTIALMAGGAGRASGGSDVNAAAGAGTPLPNPAPDGDGAAQVVSIRAEPAGYDKEQVTVKAGLPVEFRFSASPNSGCGRQLILDGFGVNLVSRSGEEKVARFTPTAPGRYNYHCGMNMFVGTLIVA